MKRAALHNLGCKVNAYETEAMQELLEQEGYVLNAKGTAYIRRNSQEFYFEHTASRTEPGVTMN